MRRIKNLFRMIAAAVFSLTLFFVTGMPAQTLTVLHEFGAPGDGSAPAGPLLFDASGNLYGTTALGPSGTNCNGNGCGTVFELSPSGGSWNESVLFGFDGSDGAYPGSRLLFDSQGNLYGTTACDEDYCYNQGFVFQLTPGSGGSWTETVLHRFSEPWEGGEPEGLLFDSNGNLDGATYYGGHNNTGTVFTLNRAANWRERLNYTFGSAEYSHDGSYPAAETTLDANGNFFGATNLGGADHAGIVFELMPNPLSVFWTESVLYTFTGHADGYYPNGVTFGPDGHLYGTTQAGGAAGEGSVFELTPNGDGTWTESVIASFHGSSDGWQPSTGVTFDAAGNIYGTTSLGGTGGCNGFGCGTVYKLTHSGGNWSKSILYRFNGVTDGAYPVGPLVLDAAGNIYGVTEAGGTYGLQGGIAFELTP